MGFEKIERYTCDMPGCEKTSEKGGKYWTTVTVFAGDQDRGGGTATRHICPGHDASTFGDVLVNTKADSKRMERQRK